jgi:hypothetical protein
MNMATQETEPSIFELYKLYKETTEKVSDRRATANTWMLSVNSALVAFYALMEKGKEIVGSSGRQLWLIALPVAGFIICMAWAALLVSYRKVNHAKFQILMEMEQHLPYALYTREDQINKDIKRWNLSSIESGIPWAFGLLYAFLAIAVSCGW